MTMYVLVWSGSHEGFEIIAVLSTDEAANRCLHAHAAANHEKPENFRVEMHVLDAVL
jgi:hypothetical protein